MTKPIAVVTGDIHFSVNTLELATSALKQAQAKAVELGVPLIMNGDTLDTKAIIRGEVANRLIDILDTYNAPETFINTGNHDLLNEKGRESSLNFLRPYAHIIHTARQVPGIGWIIPYHTNQNELAALLAKIPENSTLFVHQGVETADLGHYVTDKTSLPKEHFKNFRVIASHYHRRQDIACGRPREKHTGLLSYVGSPYSLSFSEAGDTRKSFSVYNDTGVLTDFYTDLRRHVIIECDVLLLSNQKVSKGDIVWVKITGNSEIKDLSRDTIAKALNLPSNQFKLDKIPLDAQPTGVPVKKLSDSETLDLLIDEEPENAEEKDTLKKLWREVYGNS